MFFEHVVEFQFFWDTETMESIFFENLDHTKIRNTLIFLDIDGTLISDREELPNESVLSKIGLLEEQNKVYICSNSFNKKRNENIRKLTNLPIINGSRKPRKKILTQVPNELLKLKKMVIGDKVLTDGLFAIRIGAKFIKVRRKTKGDRLIVRVYNFIDDLFYMFFKFFGKF